MRRPFSCSAHFGQQWLKWGQKKKKPQYLLSDDLTSPISGFVDDNASLGRVNRPSNELKLRCTELDENGNVTLVSGEFKKSELIQKVSSTRFYSLRNEISD